MIVEYVRDLIKKNYLQAKKNGLIGKFILRNYHKSFYEKLIDSVDNNEILFISDKDLNVKNKNFKKVTKEELAQYRNENVKNKELKNIFYIVFITDNIIDTLNDLATLSVDDVKNRFLNLLENLNIENEDKNRLKEFFKLFIKEFEEADIFEIENFLNEILEKYENGYPLNEAIGDSLIYSFKCRECVKLDKLKDFFKEYKKLSNYFYKKKGLKDISEDDLIEAFNENKEDFETLEENKLELIKEFIKTDISDENYDRFRKLDYKEDLVYKLFEKISLPAKKLGEEIIDYLEAKDVLDEEDKIFLQEFDLLKPKDKEKQRETLKEIVEKEKYKSLLEENRKLLKKIEKFLYPKEIKESNFFTALIKLISEIEEADYIKISLNKKSKKAINEAYSKYALNYLKSRILPAKNIFEKIEFDIDLDYEFDNEKTSSRYNDLVFIATIYKDDESYEKRFTFKYPVRSILNGYSDDVNELVKNLENKKLSSYKTYINKNFSGDISLYEYASFEKENVESFRFIDESDEIGKIFNDLEALDFVENKNELKEKIEKFLFSYKESLKNFNEENILNLDNSYKEVLNLLHKYKDYDKFKRLIIKLFINLVTVKVDKNLIIIPAYHPLRLISYFYKLKKLNKIVNQYFENKEFIKEELFFEDLIYDFTSIHYPEMFKDEEILKVSEVLDDYSLFENVKKEKTKMEESKIFSDVIKEYLDLNKHKETLKIFIHSIKDNFALDLLKKFSQYKDYNIEIYFNDLDEKNIQKVYKSMLKKEDLFELSEISFISNIKFNSLKNSFRAIEDYKDKFNLSFLKDFITEKAKITKEERVCKKFIKPVDYSSLVSKRKFFSQKEERISKYLINPLVTETVYLFYSLIDEKIPALSVYRDDEFNNLRIIHNKSDWVVNLDEVADKKIIQDFGANVIKYKKNNFLSKNLIISSKANTKLLENNLKKKLNELNVDYDVCELIEEANKISGDLVLKALKKGKFANDLIGVVLAKRLFANKNSIIIHLDEYKNYFKENSTLSDLLIISVDYENKLKLSIDLIETKFCQLNSSLEKKSFLQAKNAYELFEKIFNNEFYIDKENYKFKIADIIIENSNKEINSLNTEEIREKILFSGFDVNLNSYSLIFNYDVDDLEEKEEDEIIQYRLGKKQIKDILEGNFFIKKETKFQEIKKNIDKEIKPEKIENKSTKIIKVQKTEENEEIINNLKNSIKRVFRYHNLRANITDIKFTPNAIRVSLKPELGWNEAMLYKTKNDFLTVEGLELLRVEALKGKYDLVFKRDKREIVYYKDLIKNRIKSEGFGNTKILVGLDESSGETVYYDLDSEDPHALVGGMTKSGKSVLLNLFIIDLITTNSPDELRLYLIDPKQVEFIRYQDIPHLEKIVTTKEETIEILKNLVDEMERRYTLFKEVRVNEIKKYNKNSLIKLPRIVVIFDEFADFMLDKEFKKEAENYIQRLSQKARAAGIHLIVSTQRPDNSVVSPLLRANLGAKFALRVDKDNNSEIILGEKGAEKLLGYGHMIAKFAGERHYIQGAFISDEEIENILNNLKAK